MEAQKNVCMGTRSWLPQGRGRSKAISRSNKRKRMATRKNRREKGSRADPRGSKPHSYGDSFSASGFIWGSQNDTNASTQDSSVVIIRIVVIKFIISPWGLTKTQWLEVTCTNINTREIMSLISRWRRKGIVKRHRQSVSIMQQLQSQSGALM